MAEPVEDRVGICDGERVGVRPPVTVCVGELDCVEDADWLAVLVGLKLGRFEVEPDWDVDRVTLSVADLETVSVGVWVPVGDALYNCEDDRL